MNDLSGFGGRQWRTASGQELTWSQMTVSHLRNTAAFIERRIEDNLSAAYAYCPQGEQAEYAVDSAISAMEDPENPDRVFAQEMRDYANWRERTTSK